MTPEPGALYAWNQGEATMHSPALHVTADVVQRDPTLPHISPLIEGNHIATTDIACRGHQKRDPSGNFTWLHRAPVRHLGDCPLQHFFAHHVEKWRFGHRWRNRIHRNLIARITARQILGQRVQGRLAGPVMRRIKDVEVVSAVGRNIDDLAHACAPLLVPDRTK